MSITREQLIVGKVYESLDVRGNVVDARLDFIGNQLVVVTYLNGTEHDTAMHILTALKKFAVKSKIAPEIPNT